VGRRLSRNRKGGGGEVKRFGRAKGGRGSASSERVREGRGTSPAGSVKEEERVNGRRERRRDGCDARERVGRWVRAKGS
jgi:hypothetical protein